MKFKHILGLTLGLLTSSVSQAQQALVPLPNKAEFTEKLNRFTDLNIICKSDTARSEAKKFQAQLKDRFSISSHILGSDPKGKINLSLAIKDPKSTSETYSISVTEHQIVITAEGPKGAFYAFQTLLQLIQKKGDTWQIPTCEISDSPRFGWRGMMLDESRHFFGKKTVKHLLDTMAAHKMNVFHWHLTDNEGWRIEIKAYPKLTSIGAWRGEGTAMDTPDRDRKVKGKNTAKYGGFYTQEDIKEIVAYAAARHITIIPEIDVPGHGLAICASYPEMLPTTDKETGKGVQGLKGNVLSVVREENYKMLDTIFGEIAALFPNQYIHIGGDEVNHNAWKASPEHRAFMKEKGMKHVGELQNYFMLRLEKILKKHGKTLMGWNEIMHGGELSKDTAVMAWISVNAGLHAARKGHPTIMTPGPHTYFDMKYPGHSETGHWWAGVVDTKRAYDWNPLFVDKLTPAQQKFIKGVHCCLWTEFVLKPADVDYKFWPRACATAEVGWTQQPNRNWKDFEKRLGNHLPYLDRMDVQYRVKPPTGLLSKGELTIKPAYPNSTTVYTLDGSAPTAKSEVYDKNLAISSFFINKLKYRTLTKNGRLSKIEKGAKRLPVGTWSKHNITKDRPRNIRFPVSIDSKGLWFADLRRTKGKHNLAIVNAEIRSGKTTYAKIQSDDLILKGRETLRLKFKLDTIDTTKDYQLFITVKGIGGNNNHGIVTFDKSIYQEPKFSVQTEVGYHGNHSPQNLTDYIDSSFFWSNRKIKTGDTWKFTFDQPVTTTQVTVPSGKAGTNDDILKSGILEYTTDGTTWHEGAPFQLGPATLKFKEAKKIKALRIKATADQENWLIIRDPQIMP